MNQSHYADKESELWADNPDVEPTDLVTCMRCKNPFHPYADIENEIIESDWCKECFESGEFLCYIFEGAA